MHFATINSAIYFRKKNKLILTNILLYKAMHGRPQILLDIWKNLAAG